MLWAKGSADAEPGSDGDRRAAIHVRLLLAADLLAVARRNPDGQDARSIAPDDLSARPAGCKIADGAASEDPDGTAAGRKNARRVPERRRLCDGLHRQMASGGHWLWAEGARL